MSLNNALSYLSQSLYSLKRDYGYSIDIYRRTYDIDVLSGRKLVDRTKIHIRRAIILPILESIDTKYRPKNDSGQYLEVGDERIIIDNKDLPKGFKIDEGDYIVYKRERYEIKNVSRYSDLGLLLTLKLTEGSQISEIIERFVREKLVLQDQLLYNKNWALSVQDDLYLTQELSYEKIQTIFEEVTGHQMNLTQQLEVIHA